MSEDELDLTDLIEAAAPPQGTPAAGLPGGHHYWCSECGGFRTHSAELRRDKRLYLTCRECKHETPLVFSGGAWTNEAISSSLRKFLGVRSERLLREFDAALMEEITKPEKPEEPSAIEKAGARIAALASKRAIAERGIEEALGPEPSQPKAASPGVPDYGESEQVKLLRKLAREVHKSKPSASRRTKIAVGLVSAPFLLMGALYLLALNGVYVWPIYYAIQPYWRPWMNEPYFYGLSVLVPVLAVLNYYIFKRGRAGAKATDHATPPRGSLGAEALAAMREASPAAAKPAAPDKKKEARPDWW